MPWDTCDHDWKLAPGDWDTGDVNREEVICTKCGCPGERYPEEGGRVDWPTT
jgi:hypothetical protein